MNYLQKEKLIWHLKLRREIYQCIGIGQYFESKTFEYLTLAKAEEGYAVKLIQVLDYRYSASPKMNEFETVEDLDGESDSKFSGCLDDCLDWSKKEFACSRDKWLLCVVDVYARYVEKKILGQGE